MMPSGSRLVSGPSGNVALTQPPSADVPASIRSISGAAHA